MSTINSILHADRARLGRTVSSMSLAGYVVPPDPVVGIGLDGRLIAAEQEIGGLLTQGVLSVDQLDRAEQLDDWIAFTPAASAIGAAVKLRRILCGQLGMFAAGTTFPRLNGADQAALVDVLRIIGRQV